MRRQNDHKGRTEKERAVMSEKQDMVTTYMTINHLIEEKEG